jgi:hypothetical protein
MRVREHDLRPSKSHWTSSLEDASHFGTLRKSAVRDGLRRDRTLGDNQQLGQIHSDGLCPFATKLRTRAKHTSGAGQIYCLPRRTPKQGAVVLSLGTGLNDEAPQQPTQLKILVAAVSGRPGFFEAKLDSIGSVLCVSRQPFVDAARRLLEHGFSKKSVLRMSHGDSKVIALTALLGVAARLTVEESAYGPIMRRNRMPSRALHGRSRNGVAIFTAATKSSGRRKL